MKRSATSSEAPEPDTTRRRRQPQISCNFCRSKKLKCDRAQPCFNCRSRGIPCDGQPQSQAQSQSQPAAIADASSSSLHDTPDILARLRRLEDAVFAQTPSSYDETPTSSSARPTSTHRHRPVELDYDKSDDSLALHDCVTFSFRIATPGEYSPSNHPETRRIDFPSRDHAASLFHDYLDASDFHVAAMLHPPSFHHILSTTYTQLRQGQSVDIGSAALILAICAATAFYWDQDLPFLFNFQSEDHAAAQSHAWRATACDLLDQSQRCASNGLETIQARLVLADLLYNMEGTTARFRYLHSCARAAAYELKLHLIDLPGLDSTDGLILREMKRRIWWYLVGTDWLCGTMGGVMDRVYTINPNQMRVNLPRYMPESDKFANGLWSEPAVLHMTLRIRIAEVCREIADALPFGSGDLTTLPYSTIAALDRKFEGILADLPALHLSVSPTDDLFKRLAAQRETGSLAVHARRARFLRPLLQVKDLTPRFHFFRRTCFKSVEAVMEIASRLLSQAVDSPASTNVNNFSATTNRSPHRSGLIINHVGACYCSCIPHVP